MYERCVKYEKYLDCPFSTPRCGSWKEKAEEAGRGGRVCGRAVNPNAKLWHAPVRAVCFDGVPYQLEERDEERVRPQRQA